MCGTAFGDDSLDIVTGSYALRYAPDIHQAFEEIHRILRPGGVAAFLDFSKPAGRLSQIPRYWLLKIWGDLWGLLLHGNPRLHGYVAVSLKTFPDRSQLRELLDEHGFALISSRRFYWGIVELIVLRKRPD